MSLWHRYRSLKPQTRVLIGVGVMAWGTIGLVATQYAEGKFDLTPTEKDKEDLGRMIPQIRTVDRDGSSAKER